MKKGAIIAIMAAGLLSAYVFYASQEKQERDKKAEAIASQERAWCASRASTLINYGTFAHGHTSAYFHDMLIGKLYCSVDAKVEDVITNGTDTAIVFSDHNLPGNVSCIYPVAPEDYRRSDMLSSIRVVFMPTNIDVERTEDGVSRSIRALCKQVEWQHFDYIKAASKR